MKTRAELNSHLAQYGSRVRSHFWRLNGAPWNIILVEVRFAVRDGFLEALHEAGFETRPLPGVRPTNGYAEFHAVLVVAEGSS